MEDFRGRVRRALRGPRVEIGAGRAKPAAVLVALHEGAPGTPYVWLLRRPEELRTHAGQVALPGGRREATDADAVVTALREASEEIGLASDRVEVLGLHDDLATGTGYVITPVIGWVTGAFEPKPNPLEATRVFAAPFATFGDEGLAGLIPYEPLKRLVRAWRVEGEIVWGATAAILAALAHRVDRQGKD